MNELTPVEWLSQYIEKRWMGLTPSWVRDAISQAKEMEKEQLEKVYQEALREISKKD